MLYIKNILFVFILYLYIFNPYIYIFDKSWGTLKILYLLIPLCFFYRKIIFNILILRYELNILIIIFFYTISQFLMGGEPAFIRTSLVNIVELIIIPSILIYFFNYFLNNKNIVIYLTLVAIIAGVISLTIEEKSFFLLKIKRIIYFNS